SSFASDRKRLMVGWPSAGFAQAKNSSLSSRQKYGPSKSSDGRITSAPLAAASRTSFSTRATFVSTSSPSAHWIPATVTLLIVVVQRGRLLLADAMEGAPAFEELLRRDADGAAAGKERADPVDRLVVVRRTVRRDDHGGVGDVEVDVARR